MRMIGRSGLLVRMIGHSNMGLAHNCNCFVECIGALGSCLLAGSDMDSGNLGYLSCGYLTIYWSSVGALHKSLAGNYCYWWIGEQNLELGKWANSAFN